MNLNPKVTQYLKDKQHPLTQEIDAVRKIILETDDRIEETIKWSSPTFMYKGNIASFFMNAKQLVSLMFHNGAVIEDPSGLLEGEGKQARTARFYNLEDIADKKDALQSVVRTWISLKDKDK